MDEDESITTRIADLNDVSFNEMPEEKLTSHIEGLKQQIKKPRVNLGGGPPGRAD